MTEYAEPSRIKRLGIKVFAALLTILTPIALVQAFSQLREAKESEGWPTVEGEVGESRVERKPGPKVSYEPYVLYRYTAAGRQYTGTRLRLHDISSPKQDAAQGVVDRYPVGARVKVHYNPKSPEEATLEPGVTWRSYAYFAFPLITAVLAFLGWRRRSSACRRRRLPRSRNQPPEGGIGSDLAAAQTSANATAAEAIMFHTAASEKICAPARRRHRNGAIIVPGPRM